MLTLQRSNRSTSSFSEVSNVTSPINSQASPLLASSIRGSTADPQATSDFESQLEDFTYGSVKFLEPWFPAINPENSQAKTWSAWKARRKVVLWTCFIAVSFTCVTNLVLAVTVWSRYKITLDGVATLYEGTCATVKRADSVIHILINVLATLLLGASNLTLQLIAAPARREVYRAHARGVWLDIGVPGFRNLWQLSRTSVVLWCFLAISSISIHFL